MTHDPTDEYSGDDGPLGNTQKVTTGFPDRAIVLRKFKVRVVDGPQKGQQFVLDAPRVTIGSHESNDLVLKDPSVSKHHAQIERRDDGYLVRDLGSTNGLLVNALRIREGFLAPKAVITLGQSILEFSPADERIAIAPSANESFGPLVGRSIRMREVFALLERFAPTDLPLLVQGESGTGKELVARGIHENSRRAKGPYRVFDCSTVARSLVESELFGHLRGSFTGAEADRPGAFELAHHGTLFIDEVGEMPLELQPKLLRVLESREVKRLGGTDPVRVDVRVVAATNKDLTRMTEEGGFREDLYYRLAVVKLELPPLRDRMEDLPPIVERLIQIHNAGRRPDQPEIESFAAETLEILASRAWKGNVRELRNAVQTALAISQGPRVAPDDLYLEGLMRSAAPPPGASLGGRSLEDVEREAIAATLAQTGWNKSQACRVLGIAYPTLLAKIKKYELKPAG